MKTVLKIGQEINPMEQTVRIVLQQGLKMTINGEQEAHRIFSAYLPCLILGAMKTVSLCTDLFVINLRALASA